jgi:adenosylmethionine-8-amino-7-oxononanoate aminotransferase
MDYPLWHGSIPMEIFIEHKLRAERFLVEGNGIRVRDQAGRWYIDARSSCWNLGLGYSAEKVPLLTATEDDCAEIASIFDQVLAQGGAT